MSPVLASAAIAIALLLGFAWLRLWPIWTTRQRGCDAFYFLLTAEAFRERRRLPIVLPRLYLLEVPEQDYPPGYSVFLGLLPARWLQRRYWLLNHVFDAMIMLGLALATGRHFGGEWGLLAGAAYAVSPFIVLEYANLTSRASASLLFAGVMLTTWLSLDGGPAWLAAAGALCVLLLFSHKMSVQLLWFLVLFLAVVRQEWEWLVPLPAAYLVAVGVAPRLFVAMQRAHIEVVRFWTRNWRHLGAHQVRDSPLYGTGAGRGYHRGGLVRSNLVHLRRLLQYNPFVLVLLPSLVAWEELSRAEVVSMQWIAGTYAFAIATLTIPLLRGLGEGTKYVKYAIPPTLFAAAGRLADHPGPATTLLAVAAAAASIWLYARIARELRHPSQVGIADDDIAPLLGRLRAIDARTVCLPAHLADLVAFSSRRPVLWGTHHHGFELVEPFFPVIREPLPELTARHGITHLLLDTRYASLDELGIAESAIIERSGHYVLCALRPEVWREVPSPSLSVSR